MPHDLLKRILDKTSFSALRGLERESLRINKQGDPSQLQHPNKLGKALTHEHITTDFSENLIELVTSPLPSENALLNELKTIQQFTYQNMDEELLWPMSMPPFIRNENDIPFARYGKNNSAKMRHLYRVGLAKRYGRIMQVIAGIHYNFSVSDEFFAAHQGIEKKSDNYMGLIRRFHCDSWIFPYLFGSSPIVAKSSVKHKPDYLRELDQQHYFSSYGTSLRMSDLGYHNNAQAGLDINYNNVHDYAASLLKATQTPYAEFTKLGVEVNGEYHQLNDSILQIENEYYGTIRPKQPIKWGERPGTALCTRGIQYVEVRLLDVNPWHPLGVDLDALYFTDIFLIYCLLTGCDPICYEKCTESRQRFLQVATNGRNPNLLLPFNNTKKRFYDMASKMLEQLIPIAELLDQNLKQTYYTESLKKQIAKVNNAELTPSARLLNEVEPYDYSDFCITLAKEHKKTLMQEAIDPAILAKLQESTQRSELDWQTLENAEQKPFADYLKDYFSQK